MARTAHIVRETSESHIDLELNLDGTGKTDIDTSVPFYNHMMTALGKHSLIDLTIHAHGDTDIDVHHTVEDTAIVFGEALKQALGDKKGIRRFADATVPLDEALAKAAANVSTGYKFLPFEVYARGKFGDYAGDAYTGKTTLSDAVASWQKDLQDYAKQQGYQVK